MLKRRRQNQTISFKDRLAEWAEKIREQAAQLPPGTERDAMLKRASQADTAAHLDDWANSPGLQPPT
jgi:RNA polymerase-binding transcription factor DksA